MGDGVRPLGDETELDDGIARPEGALALRVAVDVDREEPLVRCPLGAFRLGRQSPEQVLFEEDGQSLPREVGDVVVGGADLRLEGGHRVDVQFEGAFRSSL